MTDEIGGMRIAAIQKFHKARRRAVLISLLSRITGESDELLSWQEVSKKLNLVHPNKRYLASIPLDKIVGSVNRYHDFNRQFYPLSDDAEHRWSEVDLLVESRGLEPVEVYKLGEVYFVYDGNHRVSVARQNDAGQIEAFVTEFRSPIEVKPDDSLLDLVLRVEREELIEDTQMDQLPFELDIQVSIPGRYHEVYEHISVHRYYLGIEYQREIPMLEAAESWAKNVYLPVVQVIQKLGVLKDFPERTETDLYLWLLKHEWELERSLGIDLSTEAVVYDLTEKFSTRLLHRIKRWWKQLFKFW
jgi:hypothetical protein